MPYVDERAFLRMLFSGIRISLASVLEELANTQTSSQDSSEMERMLREKLREVFEIHESAMQRLEYHEGDLKDSKQMEDIPIAPLVADFLLTIQNVTVRVEHKFGYAHNNDRALHFTGRNPFFRGFQWHHIIIQPSADRRKWYCLARHDVPQQWLDNPTHLYIPEVELDKWVYEEGVERDGVRGMVNYICKTARAAIQNAKTSPQNEESIDDIESLLPVDFLPDDGPTSTVGPSIHRQPSKGHDFVEDLIISVPENIFIYKSSLQVTPNIVNRRTPPSRAHRSSIPRTHQPDSKPSMAGRLTIESTVGLDSMAITPRQHHDAADDTSDYHAVLVGITTRLMLRILATRKWRHEMVHR